MKLLEQLNNLIKKMPEHNVLLENGTEFTYSDIKEHIELWKNALILSGVAPRQKVVISIKKTIDIVAVYFALCELDCINIPVDTSSGKSTVLDVIKKSKANFVITSHLMESKILKKTTALLLEYNLYQTYYEDYDVPNEIMQFLYTSGTTGKPKCVMFSKKSMANNIINISKALALSKNDIIYTPISLLLPAALNTVLLPAVLTGAKVFVLESTVPSYVLRNILEQNITVFFAVPFYYKILSLNRLCTQDIWEKVRLCITSSSFLSKEDFMRFYDKTKQGLHSIYCSSEAGVITYNNSEKIENLCNFVGKPLEQCEVSLINVDSDGSGEIIVRGDNISQGYYQNEELNKKVYCDGWVRTGDVGYIHKNGEIEIKGRSSENINIAGHLVSPIEIEHVIMNVEGVEDVVVYRYLSSTHNDMLGVKIIIREGYNLDENIIINYCKEVLPSYKVPKKVQFVDNIDTGRYGKKIRYM